MKLTNKHLILLNNVLIQLKKQKYGTLPLKLTLLIFEWADVLENKMRILQLATDKEAENLGITANPEDPELQLKLKQWQEEKLFPLENELSVTTVSLLDPADLEMNITNEQFRALLPIIKLD